MRSMVTETMLPISEAGPSTCTACSQGDRPASWPGPLAGPFQEHVDGAAEHRRIEAPLLLGEQRLQPREPLGLHRFRHLVGIGRRRACRGAGCI